MSKLNQGPDRRARRSAYVPHAVRFQLEHVRNILELDAIVLADDLGFPVAQAGHDEMANLLAESAMWTERCGPAVDPMVLDRLRQLRPGLSSKDVASKVIDLPGPSAFWRITAIGRSAMRYVGVEHAEAGIRRILDQAAETLSQTKEYALYEGVV